MCKTTVTETPVVTVRTSVSMCSSSGKKKKKKARKQRHTARAGGVLKGVSEQPITARSTAKSSKFNSHPIPPCLSLAAPVCLSKAAGSCLSVPPSYRWCNRTGRSHRLAPTPFPDSGRRRRTRKRQDRRRAGQKKKKARNEQTWAAVYTRRSDVFLFFFKCTDPDFKKKEKKRLWWRFLIGPLTL